MTDPYLTDPRPHVACPRQARMGRRSARWRIALAAGLCALGHAGSASAGELRNIVKDLYGGDGIILSQTSNVVHEAHFTTFSLQGLENLNSAIASNLGILAFNSGANRSPLNHCSKSSWRACAMARCHRGMLS